MAAFFFDHDAADKRVRRALERLGHRTTSAAEQRLHDASDRELLHYAGQAALILVTHNTRDFAALHDTEPGAHAGIIAIPDISADGVRARGCDERADHSSPAARWSVLAAPAERVATPHGTARLGASLAQPPVTSIGQLMTVTFHNWFKWAP